MSTALVLARPERRRILRELLSQPQPWNTAQRILYRDMLHLEFIGCLSLPDDDYTEAIETRVFCALVLKGTRPERARELAGESARDSIADLKRESSPGRQERERRRAFREAVTHFHGRVAVTTGLVEKCIVCGAELKGRHDSAYCSNACRQAAYRRRKRQGQTDQSQAASIRERGEIQVVLAKYGISRKQARRMRQLADIPEGELTDLIRELPDNLSARILALHRNGAS